ncbi:MAG TPA: hypothetical protein EYQ27_14960 [Gemmatimonadetes bacterium]|jgi:hypothetical protein|nr:hypothetical protein [Gemmatimonadota bacterium]
MSLLAMTACHTYTPVESPAVGTVARVTVPVRGTTGGASAAVQAASLEGVVVNAGDTIVLAMPIRREWGDAQGVMRIDTVRLLRDQLSAIEAKRPSTGKSVLLGAAIAGGVATLAVILDIKNGGDQSPVPDDDEFPPGGAVVTLRLASVLAWLFGGG